MSTRLRELRLARQRRSHAIREQAESFNDASYGETAVQISSGISLMQIADELKVLNDLLADHMDRTHGQLPPDRLPKEDPND